jgi:molybdate transport system permease protein
VNHPRQGDSAGWQGQRGLDGVMLGFLAIFVGAILLLVVADLTYVSWSKVAHALVSDEILAAMWLSLWTTTLTTALGMLFSVPVGYALSRYRFPGHSLTDSIVDLPVIMPPLILGLSLLVFFQTPMGRLIENAGFQFVYQRKGIVLCQFLTSVSLGIRALKLAFDDIDPRYERVALTLGCTRWQAFWNVALPMAWSGLLAGGILIWTRAFGIFGPILIFVGAVRNRTEILPTTIYLEQSIGRDDVALAVALLMLLMATIALVAIRCLGGYRHDPS